MRISDWISDVCSSDLAAHDAAAGRQRLCLRRGGDQRARGEQEGSQVTDGGTDHGDTPCDQKRVTTMMLRRSLSPAPSICARPHSRPIEAPGEPSCAAPASRSPAPNAVAPVRTEAHTHELPSLMRISYAVFCLTHKTNQD